MSTSKLAIDGGAPVRTQVLPYARQLVDEDDVAAVAAVLRSDWLTTGPAVASFEQRFAAFVHAGHGVAVSSGTAALHAAMFAAGIGPGDEVIVPAMTFAASANCVLYQGGTPVFADVDPETLLLDSDSVASRITPRTRVIVAVDYAGQPADYDRLRTLAGPDRYLIADACHAVGALDGDRRVGALADLNTFSLHPAKHITAGEGGVVTTDDARLAERVRLFRNHGITTDHRQRAVTGAWYYEMVELGHNLRLTDIQSALAESQLRKLPQWLTARREIARAYDEAFAALPAVRPLATRDRATHAYHLYVVQLDLQRLRVDRDVVFRALRAEGIGVNVHYIPVHLHPFYRRHLGTGPGQCPVAEDAYRRIISLPMFAGMTARDVADVVAAVEKVVAGYLR